MTDQRRTIQLPEELCARAEQRYAKHFANVEDLIVFVLQNLMNNDASELDRREYEIVEQRLKDLGYL